MEVNSIENIKTLKSNIIEGSWVNSSGAVLVISKVYSSGYFSGRYISIKNIKGNYPVIGFTNPDFNNVSTNNIPVSFSIHWESINPDFPTKNNQRHWVSAMNGIFFIDDNKKEMHLKLLHGTTASSELIDADIYESGIYTESLLFTKHKDEATTIPRKKAISLKEDYKYSIPKIKTSIAELPNYININPKSIYTLLTNVIVSFEKEVSATLSIKGVGDIPITGFCDKRIPVIDDGYSLRSISFSGAYIDGNEQVKTISLTGFIDLQEGHQMTLSCFTSKSLSNIDNKQATTKISQETFTAIL